MSQEESVGNEGVTCMLPLYDALEECIGSCRYSMEDFVPSSKLRLEKEVRARHLGLRIWALWRTDETS